MRTGPRDSRGPVPFMTVRSEAGPELPTPASTRLPSSGPGARRGRAPAASAKPTRTRKEERYRHVESALLPVLSEPPWAGLGVAAAWAASPTSDGGLIS
jgi:hypothetical protein